ncbi:hypothetical protein Sps_00998 [Shewanella psychrophila]|uniref:Uncharacterized protein n=1 Tax=Shewanella psychrophila TaxID=225848 RepID=A0A1S6HKZ1_9GAMM|nr:hypothetical protein [Shewanella psychrophila]AQS36187.1 hypothetical protein Sps_00998 [Shewanella psychrophila]
MVTDKIATSAFVPMLNIRCAIRLTPEQAAEKRSGIRDRQVQVLSDQLWLARDGDNLVAKACHSAFKEMGCKGDKAVAAKQHMLSYGALKLDRLVSNGSSLADPVNNKWVLSKLAGALDMTRASAGKSALESAARVIVDKAQLDRVEHDSPEIKKAVRDKLTLKLLDCLTHEMNLVVNQHIEKNGLSANDGHLFTSHYIDHKVYDELLLLKQTKSRDNLLAVSIGLV